MKTICLLLLYIPVFILLSFCDVFAQNNSDSKVSFGIGGGIGRDLINVIPYIQNKNLTTFTYKGKPEKDFNGKYTGLDENGNWKEFKLEAFNAEGYARLFIPGKRNNGWLINTGYVFSRNSYSYNVTPSLSFKGYSGLSVYNTGFNSHAFQLGLARFWNNAWFTRVNGIYFQKFIPIDRTTPIKVGYLRNFTEQGTGYIIGVIDEAPNKFAIVPEIGVTSHEHPIEISLLSVLPLSSYAFAEKYAYYKNRQWAGEAIATYSTFSIAINIRVGFTLFQFRQRYKKQPTFNRNKLPSNSLPSTQPNMTENGKFAAKPLNAPINLSVYFDLTKANLLPQSNTELEEVAQWLRQNPNVSIRLEGHTDKIGDADKNLQLSRDRVNAVREYLMVKGISGTRIEVRGYGDTRLLCPSPCERNRRVEMVITKR